MPFIYAMIIIMITGIITISVLRRKWGLNKKPVDPSNEGFVPVDPSNEGFDAIKEFNEDEHIEKTFKEVLNSVVCENWETDHGYDELIFKKYPDDGSRWDEVQLKVKYQIKNDKFNISGVYLVSKTVFSYKVEKLDLKHYKFFYDHYVEYINSKNDEKKKSVDSSLDLIKKVVSKSAIRDSKIDDILG